MAKREFPKSIRIFLFFLFLEGFCAIITYIFMHGSSGTYYTKCMNLSWNYKPHQSYPVESDIEIDSVRFRYSYELKSSLLNNPTIINRELKIIDFNAKEYTITFPDYIIYSNISPPFQHQKIIISKVANNTSDQESYFYIKIEQICEISNSIYYIDPLEYKIMDQEEISEEKLKDTTEIYLGQFFGIYNNLDFYPAAKCNLEDL